MDWTCYQNGGKRLRWLHDGRRSIGSQKLRHKDVVKRHLKNIRYDLGKRHISILSTTNVIWTFFWRPSHPPLEAVLISVVYKNIKVHLGQSQELTKSICDASLINGWKKENGYMPGIYRNRYYRHDCHNRN